ncbi:MAG: hypothetical protein KGJ07_06485 [Patescibacteria group bacterium]|nr:hypothetical protein [Patescibacteria group bacterium]
MPQATALLSKKLSSRSPEIVIENIFLGGIADSTYVGLKNSVTSIVGFDIHSVPGALLVAQQMTLESGAPTDDLYKILPCSDGNIYLFGKTNGKVYKNASGTYTLLGTVSPAAGSAGILDAIEFNNNIYYFMQSRVGEWTFASAFSTRNDSKFTFSVTNSTYHPSIIVNDVLYIGDGTNIAQIDTSDVFTGNALVLSSPQIICSLGRQVTDLLIGTIISNSVPISHVFRWDTWSISYTNDYPVPEVGVNCFIQAGDTDVQIQAGLSGNIYALVSSVFKLIKQVPSNFPTVYSPSAQANANYPAVAVLNGVPLFGMSNVTGNPGYQGVYAYGSHASNYPKVLSLPYPISTGNLSNVTVWSLAVVGLTLYISWKDTTSGTVYGVDKLDYSNKFTSAFFETRLIKFSRIFLDIYSKVVVNYQTLPASCDIKIYQNSDWAGYVQYTGSDIYTDSDRTQVVGNLQPRAKSIMFKIEPVVSGNNAPIIEDVIVLPE